MQNHLVSLLLVILITLPTLGRASSFPFRIFSAPATFVSNKQTLLNLSQKSYDFLTKLIPDQVDRTQNPIKIKFVPLQGRKGFTSKTEAQQAVILISDKIKTFVEYQLVLVHELTHVLRHQYNPNEELWLDEGLGKLMELLYAETWTYKYQEKFQTYKSLILTNEQEDYYMPTSDEEKVMPGYVSSLFFTLYLYRHLGKEEFIKQLGASRESGWEAIEKSALILRDKNLLAAPKDSLNRKTLWRYFSMSLLFNDLFLAPYGLFLLDTRYTPLMFEDAQDLANRLSVFSGKSVLAQTSIEICAQPAQIQSLANSKAYFVHLENGKWKIDDLTEPVQCPSQNGYLVQIVSPK